MDRMIDRLDLPPGRPEPVLPRVLIADDQSDVLEALRLLLKGEGYRIDVVALFDALNVPAEGGKTLDAIFGKGELRAAFDGDVVVGIERDQFAQPQMTASDPASDEMPSSRSPSLANT